MEKDSFFQVIIVPSKTDYKNFKAYLESLCEQMTDFRYDFDKEHFMLDIWYKDIHYLLRCDKCSYVSYMNFIEGFVEGILYATKDE